MSLSHVSTSPTTRQTVLRTPRLILRAATLSQKDVQCLHIAMSDPEVMRYWSTPPHASLSETESWLSATVKSDVNGQTDWLICLPDPPDAKEKAGAEKVIGKIGVWQGTELGFLLARSCWGKGIAREAVEVVLDYLFFEYHCEAEVGLDVADDDLRFVSIMCNVDPRNERSLKLLESLGFQRYAYQEKTLLVGDEWVDSVYLKLEKSEWEEHRRSKTSEATK